MKQNKQYNLLIVDDNNSNIDLLFHSLSADYNIFVAINGTTAIKVAKEKQPDCILLDIAMPGMDGFDVLQNLKEDPITAAIPVIFVTGKSNYEDRAKGYEMGAVDYITKPLELIEVKNRLRAQLELITFHKEMTFFNEILRDLKILYWRYNHKNDMLVTCGSIESCLGIPIKDNDIFSDQYQRQVSSQNRSKRKNIIERIKQGPQNYILEYTLENNPEIVLKEKGFISKTNSNTSFGYIIKKE